MPDSGLKGAIGDIRRFRTVMTVLFEEGLSFFLDDLQIRYLVPLTSRMRYALRRGKDDRATVAAGGRVDPPLEVRLRRSFERLGPTFVKLGQILSLRPDIVPPEFAREFAKLQNAVHPLAPGVAEKIVERELGQPIENVFSFFEEKPLAAASLAQVHRATLRDGTRVAVKVRRPGVERVLHTDIRILAYVAALLESSVPESRRFRPTKVTREFADWTLREIDFEVEGANMDRFREMFAQEPSVVIPKVYWEHVTKAVLVSDLVEGKRIDDLEALKKAHIDRKALALVGLKAGLRQYFLEGFFHADPHPGNLVALRPPKGESELGPRLGMYDFGMTGTLSQKSRTELLSCFASFVANDVEGYVRHILDLAEAGPGADVDAFSREASSIVTGVLYKPAQKKGIALAFYEVLLAGARHGVQFPTDLILLGKAFFTLETIGLTLYPEIDLRETFGPYLQEALAHELSPSRIASQMRGDAFDALYLLKHLPEQTRAILERLEHGTLGVKIDLAELEDLKREFDRQNDVRVLAVLAVALLIGAAIVLRLDAYASMLRLPLGAAAFAAGTALIVWLFILIGRRPRS